MLILSMIFLLFAHFVAGSGLLDLFKLKMNRGKHLALSMLTGLMLHSFVPFLLELMFVPLYLATVSSGIVTVCILTNLHRLRRLKWPFQGAEPLRFLPSLKLYEWPFVLIISLALIASLWRSFYFPPNARDMLSGPEAISEYAVREHTMINSVFTVNLETTNNHQKPPYVTGLQIIYKFFGFPFGQIWVSFVGIFFMLFLYQLLKERIHPVIGGILLVFFLAIPEVFAYTYVMLFDYSNMVFFFLAFYFLNEFFQSGHKNNFYFSGLLFGFATFIRLETLIFTLMVLPAFWLYGFRNKSGLKNIVVSSLAYVAVPLVVYLLWVNVYMRFYMPAQFSLGEQINSNLSDFGPLFQRFREMNTELIFGKYSLPLWAHFFTGFIVIALSEILILRKISRESRNWYYALMVVYFGLPFLGFVLPLMDLFNTTKRGLFKLMPFMLLIMANNGFLRKLSAGIYKWEANAEGNKPLLPEFSKPGSAKKVQTQKGKGTNSNK